MELYASDMFFLGNNEKEQLYDCCIHGKIIFKIGDILLSDDTNWCVSASAYKFLHTLFENHFMDDKDQLIPCCGHTMIPSEDEMSVSILGCNNGIDFNIIHTEKYIDIITADNSEYHIPFEDYKNAVISFAKQIMDFFRSSPPREFNDDFDKRGFSAFVTEWYLLYDKAISISEDIPEINPITFDDYDICNANDIVNINECGISVNSFRFINFKKCAYNFKQTEGGLGKCIGERDITDLSFTFYTSPKPITIKFIKKNKFAEFFTKRNTLSHFHYLQNQIVKYGYSTWDMT